jgi:hypothetical protein
MKTDLTASAYGLDFTPSPFFAEAVATPKNPAPANRRAGPCRLASLLINQHSGAPFFPELYPEYENLLPAEQALWAVGVQGIDARGRLYARAVLYGFEQDRLTFTFHGDLDARGPDGGSVRPGRRPGVNAHVPPAKLAALNWVMGALFGAVAPGSFDLEPALLTELLRRPIPRKEYAFERTASSCADMFRRHCELLPVHADDLRLKLPDVIPMLSPDQMRGSQEEIDALPVTRFPLTPEAFRAHALNRLALGLRKPDGDFRAIKARFARQFEIAQELLDKKNTFAQISQLARAIDATKKDALAHLAAVRIPEADRPSCMTSLVAAIKCLETFYRHRDEEGRVVMYCPGRPKTDSGHSEADVRAKRDSLFETPLLRAVSGYPVQVVDGFLSDGYLPDDGRDLAGDQ